MEIRTGRLLQFTNNFFRSGSCFVAHLNLIAYRCIARIFEVTPVGNELERYGMLEFMVNGILLNGTCISVAIPVAQLEGFKRGHVAMREVVLESFRRRSGKLPVFHFTSIL